MCFILKHLSSHIRLLVSLITDFFISSYVWKQKKDDLGKSCQPLPQICVHHNFFLQSLCLAVSWLLLFWWNFYHPPKVMQQFFRRAQDLVLVQLTLIKQKIIKKNTHRGLSNCANGPGWPLWQSNYLLSMAFKGW